MNKQAVNKNIDLYKITEKKWLCVIYVSWKIGLIILLICLFLLMDYLSVFKPLIETISRSWFNLSFWNSFINSSLIVFLYSKLGTSTINSKKIDEEIYKRTENFLLNNDERNPFYFYVINNRIYISSYVASKMKIIDNENKKMIAVNGMKSSSISPLKNIKLLKSIKNQEANILDSYLSNIKCDEIKLDNGLTIKRNRKNCNPKIEYTNPLAEYKFKGPISDLEYDCSDREEIDNLLDLNILFSDSEYDTIAEIFNILDSRLLVD